MAAQHGDVEAIQWHMWPGDPFWEVSQGSVDPRCEFYGVHSAPDWRMDGCLDPGHYSFLQDHYLQRKAIPSPLTLAIGGRYDWRTGRTELEIEITALGDLPEADLRLYLALTESRLHHGTGPDQMEGLHNILRTCVPEVGGTPLDFDGPWPQTLTVSLATHTALYEAANCRLVAWVQLAEAGEPWCGEVLQAAGRELLDLRVPEAWAGPTFKGAFPNPVGERTEIVFALDDPAGARLSLHDIRGRRICELGGGGFSRGEQSLAWKGCDSAGRRLPAGLYLLRLESGGRSDALKVMLLD